MSVKKVKAFAFRACILLQSQNKNKIPRISIVFYCATITYHVELNAI